MLIRFDTTPDRRRLTAAIRRAYRTSLLSSRILGVIVGLLALERLQQSEVFDAAVLAALALCCLWLAPTLQVDYAVRTCWRLEGVPKSWEINDDGVREASVLGESLFRWTAVMDAELMRDQILLRLTKYQLISLPTAYLTPEQRDELVVFLRERGLFRAGRAPVAGPRAPEAEESAKG